MRSGETYEAGISSIVMVTATGSTLRDDDVTNADDINSNDNVVNGLGTITGQTINVHLDKLLYGKTVYIRIYNVAIPAITDRVRDETSRMIETLEQVVVTSQSGSSYAFTGHTPYSFLPEVGTVDSESNTVQGGSDTQPTVTVKEKKLGEVKVTAEVTEGEEESVSIEYVATEDLAVKDGDAPTFGRIQVTLPEAWIITEDDLGDTVTVTGRSVTFDVSLDDEGD